MQQTMAHGRIPIPRFLRPDPDQPERNAIRLGQYVHFCMTDTAAVFLDLARDAYIGIGGREAELIRTVSHNREISRSAMSQLTRVLAAHGLLADNHAVGRHFVPATPPPCRGPLLDLDADIELRALLRIDPKHIWRLFRAIAATVINFRFGSLRRAVDRIQRRRKHGATGVIDLRSARVHVGHFLLLRPLFYAARGRCLFDSLVLVEFLSYYGLYPNLVLGVRTNPFKAHCWVEGDGFVFNDNPAITGGFAAILVA